MDDNFVKVSGMKSLAVNSLLNDMYTVYGILYMYNMYVYYVCTIYIQYVQYVCIHYTYTYHTWYIMYQENHVSHSVFYNISCIVDYTCYRSY